jgi:hypothetical protein
MTASWRSSASLLTSPSRFASLVQRVLGERFGQGPWFFLAVRKAIETRHTLAESAKPRFRILPADDRRDKLEFAQARAVLLPRKINVRGSKRRRQVVIAAPLASCNSGSMPSSMAWPWPSPIICSTPPQAQFDQSIIASSAAREDQ